MTLQPVFLRTQSCGSLPTMSNCELITIGSELLNGSVLNTNAQFLSNRITKLNIDVVHQVTCRDREGEIVECLRTAFGRSDLIIVTGGLGPTPDDITREAIACYFRCELKFDAGQYRQIVAYFKRVRKTPPFMTKREAYRPEIAKPLINRFGIALGFYIETKGKLLVVLPGVPRELINMYETTVEQLVVRKFKDRIPVHVLEARIVGLYETEIMRKLKNSFFKNRAFEFGIYPEIGEVIIRIKSPEKGLISTLRREMSQRLGFNLYNFDGQTLPEVLGQKLVTKKLTLSVAESCTGGLLSERLTNASGASKFFKGGVIAYSNEIKKEKIGIPAEDLKKYGAVSKEVAQKLAQGVRLRLNTSLGISITGIAGPTGGSKKKPVGLVYIGISDRTKTHVWQYQLSGERSKVRLQAAQKALYLLYQWLNKK